MGTQYAVGVGAKWSTHTVYLANIGLWGPLPLVQKGQTLHSGDAVDMQYAVGIGARRSIHTVHLANMGGGDVTFSAKMSNPMQWGHS